MRPFLSRLTVPLLALCLAGCSTVIGLGLKLFYERQPLPEANIRRDLAYRTGPGATEKHRLDLFLPLADSVRTRPWPVVVFVHGGGWTTGDRALRVGGEDVYGNIGRFLARHGIGAAVVSYRLLPAVAWPEQLTDVAGAVAYVHRTVGALGGNPNGLFLMGHSAGGQLAARVALDTTALAREGVPGGAVCGVIPVSGAGLDLTDYPSVRGDYDYYGARFAPRGEVVPKEMPETPRPWQREASVLPSVRRGAPPFLIVYAGGETRALQRQAEILAAALRKAAVPVAVTVVPGQSHERIVPTLSRNDRTAGPAILDFVRRQRCR